MKRFLSAGSLHHFRFQTRWKFSYLRFSISCVSFTSDNSSFALRFLLAFQFHFPFIKNWSSRVLSREDRSMKLFPILKKKRRDKYCKYNIISMQPWRKNMEYGYFNWRESSLKHDEIYIEKFRPYFQLYCSYLIPLSFIPFLFIYFQWDNPYIYSLQIFLSTINRQKNILWKICSFFVF